MQIEQRGSRDFKKECCMCDVLERNGEKERSSSASLGVDRN